MKGLIKSFSYLTMYNLYFTRLVLCMPFLFCFRISNEGFHLDVLSLTWCIRTLLRHCDTAWFLQTSNPWSHLLTTSIFQNQNRKRLLALWLVHRQGSAVASSMDEQELLGLLFYLMDHTLTSFSEDQLLEGWLLWIVRQSFCLLSLEVEEQILCFSHFQFS